MLSRLLRVCRDSVLTRCRAALLLPVTIAVVTAMLDRVSKSMPSRAGQRWCVMSMLSAAFALRWCVIL